MYSFKDQRVGNLQSDKEVIKEEKVRLNEKISVKIKNTPIFKEEIKMEETKIVTMIEKKENNFGIEKVVVYERDIIEGMSACCIIKLYLGISDLSDKYQPQKKKKKSLFSQMMVGLYSK